MSEVRAAILEQLNNNLNSAGALAELDKAIKNNVPSNEFVEFLDEAFGLKLAESTPDISDELKAKIAERKQAKTERDFAKSDALRDEIARAGIKLLDGANEMLWQYE